jgi:hypothetical protein
MINHWLSKSKRKKILSDIDDIGMDVWGDDGTFGDFFNNLSQEQKDFLMSLSLSDFVCDINRDKVIFELESPN